MKKILIAILLFSMLITMVPSVIYASEEQPTVIEGISWEKKLVSNAGAYSNNNYYYTSSVITIPEAGTTVYFVDQGINDTLMTGNTSGFAHYNTAVVSFWKKDSSNNWVIDPERSVFTGFGSTANGIITKENVKKVITNVDGNDVTTYELTYTYTTGVDNENIRFCYALNPSTAPTPTVYAIKRGDAPTDTSIGLPSNVTFTEDAPGSGKGTIEGLQWVPGMIGSPTYSVSKYAVYYGAAFANTRVFCVPKAGTKITFTDDDGSFAGTNHLVFSTWKLREDGVWVADKNVAYSGNGTGANLIQTAKDTETNSVTYTYITSKDNEYLRLSYSDGAKDYVMPRTPDTIYWEETNLPGTWISNLGNPQSKINTTDGAAIRLSNEYATSGLRVETKIDKYFYDSAVSTYGIDNVEVGTIFAPKAFVDAAGAFTQEALDSYKVSASKTSATYLKTVSASPYKTDGDNYTFVGSVVNIKNENLSLEYSAIGYIKIQDTIYYSSAYSTRSVSTVADAALADVSETMQNEYRYSVSGTSPALYSPYTADQRGILNSLKG